MSFAWEGADRLSGGSGDLSERFAQELSEPVTQRIMQEDDSSALGPMKHAARSLWSEGDITTTNVITAIMQASSLHMALPSQCRAACRAHLEALQLAWKSTAAQHGHNSDIHPTQVLRLDWPAVSKLCWKSHRS